jgi:ketosteroid isomerase-like protein
MLKIKRALLGLMSPLVCIAIFASAGISQPRTNNEASIRKLLNQYDNAWNKKDVKWVDSVLAENYVYFSSTGGTTSRKETLDFLGSPKYVLRTAQRTEIVQYASENAVIVSSRWQGHGVHNGEDFDDDQRCGLVFVKEKTKWKLLSEHCTQIEKKILP